MIASLRKGAEADRPGRSGAALALDVNAMPDPEKHPDLHGNVPDDCRAALLIVDVLNALRFENSDAFVPRATAVGRSIATLKQRASGAGVPAIYVNDNAGRWRSDVTEVVAECTRVDAPGRELSRLLLPDRDDYVVLKPKHSGFYATTLDTLLTYLGARRLVITGLSVERCLLFTANDAFLRDYELFVPRDCTAAIDEGDAAAAFRILERVLGADTSPSDSLDIARLLA
jgi:nicotinamidase-related amidase